mgnify:FL=1|jgi:predicted kinase
MLINKELCAVAVALLAVSSIGYWLGASHTSARYEKMIQAKEIAVLEAQQQERKEHDAKLIEATNQLRNELNQSNDLARARGADVERLRNANAKLQARIKASPAEPNAEALARCSQLLSEGAGLVTEGERLLLKHGAEHDSLIRIEKWQ